MKRKILTLVLPIIIPSFASGDSMIFGHLKNQQIAKGDLTLMPIANVRCGNEIARM
jgi:hypothetical protein